MEVRSASLLRFGVFVLDCETGELTKNGRKAALRPQSVRVLAALASRSGQLFTRDELRLEIWGEQAYGDFEHGLNLCIQEIRAVLHDDATSPRFIQTLPRRGYRFIAPVSFGDPEPAASAASEPVAVVESSAAEVDPAPAAWRRMLRPALMITAGLAAAIALLVFFSGRTAAQMESAKQPRSASIALLPLTPGVPGTEGDDLAAGVTMELTKQLGRVESLRIISPYSMRLFSESKEPLTRIGRQLNVSHVLSGSVQRTGDRLHMRLALADARSGNKLWARSYDSDLGETFETDKDVAQAVARALDLRLTGADEARLRHTRPVDPKANAAFLQGITAKSPQEAQAKLEQAVAIDPNFSLAWATLGMMYINRGWFSQTEPPMVTFAKAKEYADRALAINDDNASAHVVLAAVKLHHDWDWPGAEREFRRAIETEPSYAPAHHIYAHYLLTMDRLRESVTESRKATELDPLNPGLSTCVGWHCLYARQYDEAVSQCLKLVNEEKAVPLTYYYLGRVYARRGETGPAIAALEVAATRSGGMNAVLATLGYVYGRAGRRSDAERILAILEQRRKTAYVAAFDFAVIYAGLGENDSAFEWLDKAAMERSTWLVHVKWDERFVTLRSDPRFAALLRRIGLPRPDVVRDPERPGAVPQTVASR